MFEIYCYVLKLTRKRSSVKLYEFVVFFGYLFTIDTFLNCKNYVYYTNILYFGFTGGMCGGLCCDPEAESSLRRQGQRDFATLLRHNSRSLQGLLNSTATMLQSE